MLVLLILKGFYMYSPFDAPIRNFHVGLSIQNIGTPVHGDPLPRLIELGLVFHRIELLGSTEIGHETSVGAVLRVLVL